MTDFSQVAPAPTESIQRMAECHLAECAALMVTMVLMPAVRGSKHLRWTRPSARTHLQALLQEERITGFVMLNERCRVIAFALGQAQETNGQASFDITELCVCAEKKPLRLGTRLVQSIEQTLRTQGIAHVTLGAAHSGAHARRLLHML